MPDSQGGDNSLSASNYKQKSKREFKVLFGASSLPRDISPLRYPGGKGSLKYLLANLVIMNGLKGGRIIEPYCGGAGASLPLLKAGVITSLWLNDANKAISSFWEAVFFDTETLLDLIAVKPVNMNTWRDCRHLLEHDKDCTTGDLAFAAFFLNRTNRSGLLKGGPIGGKAQNGKYKMGCRYNKENLISRIQSISKYRDNVRISNADGVDYLSSLGKEDLESSLVFIDPPYVQHGYNIYREYSFRDSDHARLASFITRKVWRWLLTYDNHPLINSLYSDSHLVPIEYSYLMQKARIGSELLISSQSCKLTIELLTSTSHCTSKKLDSTVVYEPSLYPV